MASEIRCGSVDVEECGPVCVFYRADSKYSCNVDKSALVTTVHPCHCNEARLAALAKQDGEMVELVREWCNFLNIGHTIHPNSAVHDDMQAALAERGVEL